MGDALPMTKMRDVSKLKAIVDGKLRQRYPKGQKFVLDRTGDMMEEAKKAGYQHLLIYPQCFQMLSLLGSFKLGIL